MHKYTVHPIQNDNDIFFCVYEEATEQAIKKANEIYNS